jgi:hypothetical protein
MRDYLTIGSTPPEEECAQVGSENYRKRAIAEIRRYRELLINTCGEPPAGTELKAKWNPHDFGEYVELVVEYDENDPLGLEYALHLESHGPSNWAGDDAKKFPYVKRKPVKMDGNGIPY